MSVSVKELRDELAPFVEKLTKAHEGLSQEVEQTKKTVDDLHAEFKGQIRSFLEKTLPGLSGSEFVRLDKLTEGSSKELGSTLRQFMQDLMDKRKQAIADASTAIKETVTIESFPHQLRAAQETKTSTEDAMNRADENAKAARKAEEDWQKSEDYQYYSLDEDLTLHGKPGLSKETRSYYDTQSMTAATLRYLTRDDSYRNVRKVLIAYDQGADGRDLFEQMQGIKDKAKTLKDTRKSTASEHVAATETAKQAAKRLDDLDQRKTLIIDDDAVLEALRDHLVENCQNATFLKAMSDDFGAEFPAGAPALAAKLKPLQSLLSDEQTRLQRMASDLKTAEDSYEKLKKARYSVQIPNLELKDLIEGNTHYLDAHLAYANAAADTRRQATDWHYSAAPQDNGLGIWNYILLYEIFSANSAPAAAATPAPHVGLPDMQTIFSSPAAAPVQLNDIFNSVVNNTTGADLSPPSTYHHSSSYDSSSYSSSSYTPSFSFDGGGMSAGGSMGF